MRKFFPLLLLFIFLLFSCNTYTILNGRENINEPVYEELKETRIKLINPPEEEATYESLIVSLIPLGERTLGDSILNRLTLSLPSSDILVFTGSEVNKENLKKKLSGNIIDLEGGFIILNNLEMLSSDGKLITIRTKTDKKITIAVEDQKPSLPSANDTDSFIKIVDSKEALALPHLAETLMSLGEEEYEILFLSSLSPSSVDWTNDSGLDYRYERSFTTSEIFNTLSWNDAALINGKTNLNNVTRTNGKIKERMDFIYTKGLNVTSCFTLPLDGLNNAAVYAVIIL